MVNVTRRRGRKAHGGGAVKRSRKHTRSSVYRRKLCNVGRTDAKPKASLVFHKYLFGGERIGRVSPMEGGSQIVCRLQRAPDENGSRYKG
jgi:hypothetical protein